MSNNIPEAEFPFTQQQVEKFVGLMLSADDDVYHAMKDRVGALAEKESKLFMDMTGNKILAFLTTLYPQFFESVNYKQLALVFAAQAMAKILFADMVSELDTKGPIQ